MGLKEDQRTLPPYEFRSQTARLLIQSEEWKRACKVLERLISENDEKTDVWYMLALCLTKLGKTDSARECLKNAKTFYKKFNLQDIELE